MEIAPLTDKKVLCVVGIRIEHVNDTRRGPYGSISLATPTNHFYRDLFTIRYLQIVPRGNKWVIRTKSTLLSIQDVLENTKGKAIRDI